MIKLVKTNSNNADTTMIHESSFLSWPVPNSKRYAYIQSQPDDAANFVKLPPSLLTLSLSLPVHSLPETTRETTAVADSGRLRNIEEARLGVDPLLHCAAPLA